MSAGRDVWLSGTLTVSGVAAQFSTLATATANKFENIIFKELIGHAVDDSGGTLTYGLVIGSKVILAGSVVNTSGGNLFVTTSGGAIPYNLFTTTVSSSGLITFGINVTAGFFATTTKTPVANAGAGSSITGLTDLYWDTSRFVDYTSGLESPISFTNGETLRMFVANSGAGTTGKFFCKVGLTIISDTQQT